MRLTEIEDQPPKDQTTRDQRSHFFDSDATISLFFAATFVRIDDLPRANFDLVLRESVWNRESTLLTSHTLSLSSGYCIPTKSYLSRSRLGRRVYCSLLVDDVDLRDEERERLQEEHQEERETHLH